MAIRLSILLFLLLPAFTSFGVSDFAYFKIGDDVYFHSDIQKINAQIKKVECLFGETLISEISKKNNLLPKDVILFRLKLIRYVKEINFEIENKKLIEMVKKNLISCHISEDLFQKESVEKSMVVSELYFQEYLLGADSNVEKSATFRRLSKLLDKRFVHFIYD